MQCCSLGRVADQNGRAAGSVMCYGSGLQIYGSYSVHTAVSSQLPGICHLPLTDINMDETNERHNLPFISDANFMKLQNSHMICTDVIWLYVHLGALSVPFRTFY